MKFLQKNSKAAIFFVLAIFLFSGAWFILQGQSSPEKNLRYQSETVPSFWALIFKTVLFLGFVIVLVVIVLYLLRRFVYQKNFGPQNQAIQLLHIAPLFAKKSLCVVRIVDKLLILGISENSIDLLSEIDDPERQQKWLAALAKSASKKSGSFANQLQSFLKQERNQLNN